LSVWLVNGFGRKKENQGNKIDYFNLSIGALFLLIFSARTLNRVPDWKSMVSLNNSAIKVSPNSARSNLFYGVAIWENQFLKLDKNADPKSRQALLDTMRPYFDKSLNIYPHYSGALKMWSGLIAEQHKLDNNYPNLIKGFERVNIGYNNQTYEPYIIKYLDYLKNQPKSAADTEALTNFYQRMITYYSKEKMDAVVKQYEALMK
jgi:hypothetical protein